MISVHLSHRNSHLQLNTPHCTHTHTHTTHTYAQAKPLNHSTHSPSYWKLVQVLTLQAHACSRCKEIAASSYVSVWPWGPTACRVATSSHPTVKLYPQTVRETRARRSTGLRPQPGISPNMLELKDPVVRSVRGTRAVHQDWRVLITQHLERCSSHTHRNTHWCMQHCTHTYTQRKHKNIYTRTLMHINAPINTYMLFTLLNLAYSS